MHGRAWIAPVVAAALAFGVYVRTLAPDITWADSGELVLAAATLGVAHPPGAPLWTLLAHLATQVPLGSVAFRVNLLSAACGSLTVGATAVLTLVLLRGDSENNYGSNSHELEHRPAGAGARPDRRRRAGSQRLARRPIDPAWTAPVGGLVAALGFAYTETFWSVTTIAEVYALALLLIALALTALFTWYLRLDRATVLGVPRSLAAFMLLWGLALGVHYSALFLAPAASLLLLARRGDWRAWGPRGGAVLIALGAVGPALYLLLPLRAAAAVPLAWGDPRTVERFLAHVSGRQYQGNLFTSDLVTIAAQGIRAMRVLANDLTPPLLALAALGAWRLGRGQPRAPFWALLATMAFTLFVAVNYNIEEDWETYLLIALLGLATLAGIGAADVVGRASRPRAALATGIVLAALPLVPLALHFGEQDHSRDHLARNYALNLLAGLEPNAVLLTRDWNVYSPLLYTQHVEQVRPDVTAIDVLLLRRSWYYRYLEEHYPWLLSGARAEVDAYLEQLAEFEAGRPYDPAAIQGRFVAMINAFIAVARRERPVYLTPGWDPGVASGLVLVPAHLAFQVLSPEEEAAGAGLGVALRAPAWDLAGVNDGTAPQDPVARRMLPTYARMELNRGLYLASEERWAESERALRDTLALAPDLAVAQSKLGLTLAVQGRDLEARAAFEAALQLDPANQEARQGWEMVRRRLGG